MQPWLYGFIITALVCVWLLYRRGFAVSKSIRAILFVFRPGRNRDRVTLNACTGWVRHHAGRRFRESRAYDFTLDLRLSKGNAEVVLLDRQRQPLLRLNRQSPTGRVELDQRGRYVLRWEFQNATGTCELHW